MGGAFEPAWSHDLHMVSHKTNQCIDLPHCHGNHHHSRSILVQCTQVHNYIFLNPNRKQEIENRKYVRKPGHGTIIQPNIMWPVRQELTTKVVHTYLCAISRH